tara:strand:- start:812 stop:1987 length:1176 start_codon:yes stop_codon:yes gene_type:complete
MIRAVSFLLFLLLTGFLGGCSENIRMVSKSCNLPCYTGPVGTAGQGPCGTGVTLCDDDDVVIDCEGEALPMIETCNGEDDDCDGKVDNNLTEDWAGSKCGTDHGICKAGDEVCDDGQRICQGREEGMPESCNRLDDDCDGLVDNNLPLELCYTGDPQTLAFGECRAGIIECVEGRSICLHQKTPTTEICDGLDNDCDGLVDEELSDRLDLFFIIDGSGSMGTLFNDSIAAIYALSAVLQDTDTLYGAATFPGLRIEGTYTYTTIGLVTDLVDAATFQGEMINATSIGGGLEPGIDAIYMACATATVAWRQDTEKHLFIFTDEEPQSAQNRTIAEATDACVGAGIVIHAAIKPNYIADYEAMTMPTGGSFFFLGTSIWMVDDLLNIFSTNCN